MNLSGLRIIEVVLYSLMNLVPYLVLCLTMFQGRLRLRTLGTAVLTVMLCVVQIGLGFAAAVFFPEHVGRISLLSYGTYMLFYITAVRAAPGPLVFMLFLVANYASFIVTMAKYLEYLLAPALAVEKYRWTFSVSTFIVQAITMPPLAAFVNRYIRPVLMLKSAERQWRYLWAIPCTFYIVWYYITYVSGAGRSALEMAIHPVTAACLFLINAGSIIVYYVVARLLMESNEKLRLDAENHSLAMQNLQFRHLQDRMEEARRARHDLRQHIGILKTMSDQKKYDELADYLADLTKSRCFDAALIYCRNTSVNAILVYYLDLAREAGAKISCHVDLDENLGIESADLTVLLGNLLENAVEALERQAGNEKFLRMTARMDGAMILTIDNSFSGELKKSGGEWMSSKREEAGVGVISVEAIVQKYGGISKFSGEGGVFQVSIMLNPHGRR